IAGVPPVSGQGESRFPWCGVVEIAYGPFANLIIRRDIGSTVVDEDLWLQVADDPIDFRPLPAEPAVVVLAGLELGERGLAHVMAATPPVAFAAVDPQCLYLAVARPQLLDLAVALRAH